MGNRGLLPFKMPGDSPRHHNRVQAVRVRLLLRFVAPPPLLAGVEWSERYKSSLRLDVFVRLR